MITAEDLITAHQATLERIIMTYCDDPTQSTKIIESLREQIMRQRRVIWGKNHEVGNDKRPC